MFFHCPFASIPLFHLACKWFPSKHCSQFHFLFSQHVHLSSWLRTSTTLLQIRSVFPLYALHLKRWIGREGVRGFTEASGCDSTATVPAVCQMLSSHWTGEREGEEQRIPSTPLPHVRLPS